MYAFLAISVILHHLVSVQRLHKAKLAFTYFNHVAQPHVYSPLPDFYRVLGQLDFAIWDILYIPSVLKIVTVSLSLQFAGIRPVVTR
jgi:hypothetical protein